MSFGIWKIAVIDKTATLMFMPSERAARCDRERPVLFADRAIG